MTPSGAGKLRGAKTANLRESASRRKLLPGLLIFLTVSAAYLFAFPQANIFYAVVVILHLVAGVITTLLLVPVLWGGLKSRGLLSASGWLLVAIGALLGVAMIFTGTARSHWTLLYSHVFLSTLGAGILLSSSISSAASSATGRGGMAWGRGKPLLVTPVCLLLVAGLGAGAWYARTSQWQRSFHIVNPAMPPETMAGEGDGPQGAFFPSSAQIYGNRKIPSKFFMESDSCQRCHQEVYKQWYSSAHHFSSFNNQWYRKSIEYMQDTVGTGPSKWCGGCHDPAVLYAGKMDTPIKQIVHTPEAQAGLGCMMCHSIARVKSTMGQGDFYLEYPTLHELAAEKNPVLRRLHDFVIQLNPEPHRRVFLKPFMRDQPAEFCAACHKVHLDVPVNHYRWIRGFNEYDNWQASGVSGEGARSFYYPAKSQQCADCHMPLTSSEDAGNVHGQIHSHRFPGANTALPTANEDAEQLKVTENFLKNVMTIDIFAMSPAQALSGTQARKPVAAGGSELSTTFAVGEEAEAPVSAAGGGDAVAVNAPLNRVHATVRRGDSVRVDVVVRTKKLGHFFPGGTVDAYDTWVELKGIDEKGQTVYWSGEVEDNGKGPVEKGAHFYRSLQIDEHGNPINKRNAWASRATVYVHLIPPGAADTVHYRLNVPESTGNQITLHARLLYRKFAWWNTQFSFGGVADPSLPRPAAAPGYDDTKYVFTGSLQGVSAKQEKIPDVPIEVMAENEVTLQVAPRNAPAPLPVVALQADDWQRWNDYGIGLFLQGDLKGAQAAFQKVTEIDPRNPDGWVNMGRVAVQEGDMDRGRVVLEKALALSPILARAHFFYAKVLRAEGKYDEAASHLQQVVAQYPRDRVAQNDLGRILFLQRRYQDAIQRFNLVLAIDPEDLQAHYNLMLCYNGVGDQAKARDHQVRYLRFKADESAQTITGPYRQAHPQDNNERQAIHEHGSVPLAGLRQHAQAAENKNMAGRTGAAILRVSR